MNNIISNVCFIDKQNQPDNIYKFVLIYQDLDTEYCILRPLTSIDAEEVAQVLIDIFSTIRVPEILKCKGDPVFPNQLAFHLYNQRIKVKIICKNIEIYNFDHPEEKIIKVIRKMLDTWSTINETNKWAEGLDIIQFQKNHNIYYEATYEPIRFNDRHSLNSNQCVTQLKSITKSICNMNTQTKNRKTTLGNREENILENLQKKNYVNDQTKNDVPLIVGNKTVDKDIQIIQLIVPI